MKYFHRQYRKAHDKIWKDPVLHQAIIGDLVFNHDKNVPELPQLLKYESSVPKGFHYPQTRYANKIKQIITEKINQRILSSKKQNRSQNRLGKKFNKKRRNKSIRS